MTIEQINSLIRDDLEVVLVIPTSLGTLRPGMVLCSLSYHIIAGI